MERKGCWRNLGALVCERSLLIKEMSYRSISLFTDIQRIGAADNEQFYLLKEILIYNKRIN